MADIHILSDRPRKSTASKARVASITENHVTFLDKSAQEQADKEEDERIKAKVMMAWKNAVARAYSIFGAEETDRLMPFVHSAMKPNEE